MSSRGAFCATRDPVIIGISLRHKNWRIEMTINRNGQPMKINHINKNEIQILELSGEIDFHTSPELREKLQKIIEKQTKKILVNLKKVSYIDSSGLATFVEALQKMHKSKGKLVLAELASAVRGVFEIAKLDTVFSLAESQDQGLKILNQG